MPQRARIAIVDDEVDLAEAYAEYLADRLNEFAQDTGEYDPHDDRSPEALKEADLEHWAEFRRHAAE